MKISTRSGGRKLETASFEGPVSSKLKLEMLRFVSKFLCSAPYQVEIVSFFFLYSYEFILHTLGTMYILSLGRGKDLHEI